MSTDQIFASDQHLIQSFADLNSLKQGVDRLAIAAGKGAYIYDSEGKRYIDGMGGLWCVNIGHGNAEVIKAITKQLETRNYRHTISLIWVHFYFFWEYF